LHGNCLLKHVIQRKIEGRIEVMERRGRRCKKLLDNLKGKKRGYCKLKEEGLKCSLWRTHFGSGYRPVIRHQRIYESTGS
jgi:hypothetical protein